MRRAPESSARMRAARRWPGEPIAQAVAPRRRAGDSIKSRLDLARQSRERTDGLFTQRRATRLATEGARFRARGAAPGVARTRPDRGRARALGLGHHQARLAPG